MALIQRRLRPADSRVCALWHGVVHPEPRHPAPRPPDCRTDPAHTALYCPQCQREKELPRRRRPLAQLPEGLIPMTTSLAIEREIRFAVVMYGGVSLAIYINGV